MVRFKKYGRFFTEKKVRERLKETRSRKKNKISQIETQLSQLWNNFLASKPDKENISRFIQNIKSPSLQKRALKIFLKLDLDFEDCFTLTPLVVQIKAMVLKRTFWKRCFNLATLEDWVSAIRFANNEQIRRKFWEGLTERIKNGSIPGKQARQILIQIFKETPDEGVRKMSWMMLRNLKPKKEELLEISGLDCMSSMIGLAIEVRTQIEQLKKEQNLKEGRISQVEQIIKAINETLKKLQQTKKGQ